jgi:hypothetical protein
LILNKTVLDVRHTLPDRVLPKKAHQMVFFVFHAASLSLDSVLNFKQTPPDSVFAVNTDLVGMVSLLSHFTPEFLLPDKPNH